MLIVVPLPHDNSIIVVHLITRSWEEQLSLYHFAERNDYCSLVCPSTTAYGGLSLLKPKLVHDRSFAESRRSANRNRYVTVGLNSEL